MISSPNSWNAQQSNYLLWFIALRLFAHAQRFHGTQFKNLGGKKRANQNQSFNRKNKTRSLKISNQPAMSWVQYERRNPGRPIREISAAERRIRRNRKRRRESKARGSKERTRDRRRRGMRTLGTLEQPPLFLSRSPPSTSFDRCREMENYG